MIEGKSFVDKVYDSYIKDDYSYGDDNLNPKREISVDTKRNTNDDLSRIIAAIQSKVDEISIKTGSLIDTDSGPTVTANYTSGLGTLKKGVPSTLRNAISKAGGSGNYLMHIPNLSQDDGIIPPDLIPILIGPFSPGPYSEPGQFPGPEDTPPISDGPYPKMPDISYIFDCDGSYDIINGDIIDDDNTNGLDDDEGDSINGKMKNVSDDNDDDSNSKDKSSTSSSDTDSGDNGSGDTNDFDTTTASDQDTLNAEFADAVDDALNFIDNDIDDKDKNAENCAKRDLAILEMFLNILKTLQNIKDAVNPTLNIAFDVAKITVLAAGCWVNPTNITEIIERIMVKLMAVMVMIISQLVQMFWEMLGLDCLTLQTQDAIRQVEETISGVKKTFNAVKRTAIQFGENVDKVEDAFDSAKDAIDSALDALTDDNFRKQYGTSLKDAALDVYHNTLGNIDNIKTTGISAIQSTGAYDDIVSTIEQIKTLRSEAQSTINTIMKTKGGKAADSTVRKIASQLHNVQAV